MKNIYLIPTDKPSRLYLHSNNELQLRTNIIRTSEDYLGTNQNIYITSDEEIKEGDYVVQINFEKTNTQVIKCETEFQTEIANDKDGSYTKNKIILTTDQDLDGVQPIDDEFLEWFVKNPSCESVEVRKYHQRGDVSFKDRYRIIIPIEEPKRKIDSCRYFNLEIGCVKDICKCEQEEPKQDLEKEMFELEQELDIPSSMRWHNSKPKQEIDMSKYISGIDPYDTQETLEEAAEHNYPGGDVWTEEQALIRRLAFKNGAKWQQKRRYSEEQLFKILLDFVEFPHDHNEGRGSIINRFLKELKKK